MEESYTVKYRPPFWPFWIPIKKVAHHWLDDLSNDLSRQAPGYVFNPKYWGVITTDKRSLYIPVTWGFIIEPDCITYTAKQMSREIGQPVQMRP